MIAEMQQERALLDQGIEKLAELARYLDQRRAHFPSNLTAPKRRGRKFMGPEERQQVAQRMKDYWAQRKQLKEKELHHG